MENNYMYSQTFMNHVDLAKAINEIKEVNGNFEIEIVETCVKGEKAVVVRFDKRNGYK